MAATTTPQTTDIKDSILDAIATETGITERATLYSSTEFKKIRLQYFTDDFTTWEREHAGA